MLTALAQKTDPWAGAAARARLRAIKGISDVPALPAPSNDDPAIGEPRKVISEAERKKRATGDEVWHRFSLTTHYPGLGDLQARVIQIKVFDCFGIDLAEMFTQQRKGGVTWAKWIAVAFIKDLGYDNLGIATLFGWTDDGSVRHGLRKVNEMFRSDPAFGDLMDRIKIEIDRGVEVPVE